ADVPASAVTLASTGTSVTFFAWAAPVAGTDATTNGCSSSTAGTFVNNSNTTNLATNVQNALLSCEGSPYNVALTSSTTGATVTVFTKAVGTTATMTVGGTMVGSGLAWGSTTSPGSNGAQSGTCSSGTGNFGLSSTAATMAGFLVTAINACTSNTGVTATNGSGGAFTVQNVAPGNFTLNTTGTSVTNSTFFNWGSVTAG